MLEILLIIAVFLAAFFVGHDIGARRMQDRAEDAAQTFIDALRDRFGTLVEAEADDGTIVEVVELPDELEELGAELFDLRNG